MLRSFSRVGFPVARSTSLFLRNNIRAFSATDDAFKESVKSQQTVLQGAVSQLMKLDWGQIDHKGWNSALDTLESVRGFTSKLTDSEKQAASALTSDLSKADKTFQFALLAEEVGQKIEAVRSELAVGIFGATPSVNHFGDEDHNLLSNAFKEYSEMVEAAPESIRRKLELDIGYRALVLKQSLHVRAFRYVFPHVHASGFSASCD